MRRLAILTALTAAILLPWSAAVADWNDGEPAKWLQLPDETVLGMDVNLSQEFILADDFECTETGPLTGIHLWCSWLNDLLPSDGPDRVVFTLSIHADIPAEQSPTGYSMPGELLWMRTFQPGAFTARLWTDIVEEGWLDPPDLYLFPGDHAIWQYNFEIPETDAFYQQGLPDLPVVYWLDVEAEPVEAGTRIGWKTSTDHWNDAAAWGMGIEPYPGPWSELLYPPGHEQFGQRVDLAFVLAGPEPPPGLDFGDAPEDAAAGGYPTTLALDGARHTPGNCWLGGPADAPDTEPDGQPSPLAMGDDLDGNDDEDGVILPVMNRGLTSTITLRVGGAGGVVEGWIDWNGDQQWQHPGEQVIGGAVLAPGFHSFSVTVPATAYLGNTCARFRISSQGGLLPTGAADDGEVEDHRVVVQQLQGYKWEQAPDLTPTGIDVDATFAPSGEGYILADDFVCTQPGPINAVWIWGSWLRDYLPEGTDPSLVRFTLSIHEDIPADQSPTGYSMPGAILYMRDFAPGQFAVDIWAEGIEEGWLEPPDQYQFPADEVCWRYRFNMSDEPFHQQGTPENPIVYWLDVHAEPQDPQARWGWKTSLDHWNDDAVWGVGFEPYPGPWRELIYPPEHPLQEQSIDLAFRIFSDPGEVYDFGDAPDPTYPTYGMHGGAYHQILPGFHLGTYIDSEPDGQPDPSAKGDDASGLSDEDGVVMSTPLIPGNVVHVTVTASAYGYLDGWIDFDQDGVWTDPVDRIFNAVLLVPGVPNNLVAPIPALGQTAGTTFARFRFSATGGLPPTGPAPEGEVEDYSIRIETDVTGTPDLPEPRSFRLDKPAPNPFNPAVLIRYQLPTDEPVRLRIYDVRGRLVRTLVDEPRPVGRHEEVWNGRDDLGRAVASGTYFCRIEAGPHRATERMTLVR